MIQALELVKNMNRKNGKFFYVIYDRETDRIDNWVCKVYWDKKNNKWVVDPKNSNIAGVEK